jgi:ribonuclease P protein component
VLPRQHRLHRAEDFSTTVKQGRRAGRRTLVAHLLLPPRPDDAVSPEQPRIGFVVGRAVGNAVTRNRVTRRLRHLTHARCGSLPTGALLVVRALAPAGHATSAELAADLDAALDHLLPPPVTS